jgi:hypothetical protein
VVPVPLAPYHPDSYHIDFLEMERWIDVGPQYPDCINLEDRRFPLTTFPGTLCKLKYCYTFHIMSQASTQQSIENHIIKKYSDGRLVWNEDVLVVKSTTIDPDSPVNMDQTDLELVTLLLLRYSHTIMST